MYWEVENGSEDITFHVCLINYSRAVCPGHEFTKVSSFQLFSVTTVKTSCSMSNITVLITVKMIILQEPAGTPSSTEKPFTLKPLDGSSTISNFCSMNKRAERMEDWTIEFNHVFFFFFLHYVFLNMHMQQWFITYASVYEFQYVQDCLSYGGGKKPQHVC